MSVTPKGRLPVTNQAIYLANSHLQSSSDSRNTSKTSQVESTKPLNILKAEASGLTVVKSTMNRSILHPSFEGKSNVTVAPKLPHDCENFLGFRNP